MKTCPKCYKEIPPDSEFCPYCGEAIKEEVTLRNENKIIDSSHTVAAHKTVEKKKRPTGIIIICAVFVLALILAGAYWGTYSAAKRAAVNQEYLKASELLFVPTLTQKHDPELLEYIDAGKLYSQGKYNEAKSAFSTLADKGYLNSKDLKLDAEYLEAVDLLERGKYTEAKNLLASLATIDYLDASDLKNEATYYEALEELKRGYLSGYRTIASLAKSGFSLAIDGLESAKKQAYDHAVGLYRKGDELSATSYFRELKGYKRSADYLTLINRSDYSAIKKLIGFENANDILIDQFAIKFLVGTWKTSDGRNYFSISSDDDGNRSTYNLPRIDLAHSYYAIEDGIYFLYDQDISYLERFMGDYERKNVFRFTIIDADTINVYCYKDGSTYKLFRQ